MRFLGGLLKTIAIILLLAATAGCTAVAVLYGGTDVYWAMGILWAVALFIALTAWGTGTALAQIHKLKKKLEQPEYRPQPALKSVSDPDFPEIHTAPRNAGKYTGQRPSGGAFAAPKASGNGIWIAVIIVLATATLATTMLLFHLKTPTPNTTAAPENTHLTTEPAVSLDALGASAAIVKIRDGLKDPNSFQLLSAQRVPYLAMYIYRIEYTATNSFGGRVKNDAYVAIYIDTAKNTAKLHSKYEHYGLQDSHLTSLYRSNQHQMESIDIHTVTY